MCRWIETNEGWQTDCNGEVYVYEEGWKFCPYCGETLTYERQPEFRSMAYRERMYSEIVRRHTA